ncbi:MAG TPA: MFS transporter [Blastocatellia bacterium]|nr:MFS transporter [Blastocatellia bacterium]
MIPHDDESPGRDGSRTERHDPFEALRFRDFRLLAIAHFVGVLGEQMVGVAIGWELYERTGSAFALGLVGLVQVVPVFLFALLAGHIADRFNRKVIVALTQIGFALAALGLVLLSLATGPIWMMYVCLFVIGTARAFRNPAVSTLLAHTVPEVAYPNAATWNSGAWQLAVVFGPALGGFIVGLTNKPAVVYGLDVAAGLVYLALVLWMRVSPKPDVQEPVSLRTFGAGAAFIWRTKEILAAITLDMFAVLLGGATALLPIFAKDILNVGPTGLGWLRAAPSIGAMLAAFAIASRPPFHRAGKTLLWAVAGFGAATIVFGLSTSFPLSLLMLALLGGLDQISVVIRGTLLLTRTPDSLRGRVSAVHNVFVGASNELGEFESGALAALFGPVIAVVGGGIGTLLVVALIAAAWPEVRRLGQLKPPVIEAVAVE